MLNTLNLNFYDLIMLLGAIQGILLSLLLYFKNSEDRRANQYLILLLVTFSIHLIHQLGFDSGFFNKYPFLHVIPYSYLYFIGPSVYFYVKTMISPEANSNKRSWLHFIPALYILPALAFYFLFLAGADKSTKLLFFKSINFVEDYLIFTSVVIYLLAAIKITLRADEWQHGVKLSKPTLYSLKWTKQLSLTIGTIILIWKLNHLYSVFLVGQPLTLKDHYPFYIVLAALIYWLGFNGYVHHRAFQTEFKSVFDLKFQSVPSAVGNQLSTKIQNKQTDLDHQEESWNKPGIQDQLDKIGLDLYKAKEILEDIHLKLQTENLYKNQKLNLQSFAHDVGYSSKVVSVLINSLLNKNFNDFINEYRVKEVLRRMKMGHHDHLTILGIAQESGFSSKSTFNRIFREVTGKTPKDYKCSQR